MSIHQAANTRTCEESSSSKTLNAGTTFLRPRSIIRTSNACRFCNVSPVFSSEKCERMNATTASRRVSNGTSLNGICRCSAGLGFDSQVRTNGLVRVRKLRLLLSQNDQRIRRRVYDAMSGFPIKNSSRHSKSMVVRFPSRIDEHQVALR